MIHDYRFESINAPPVAPRNIPKRRWQRSLARLTSSNSASFAGCRARRSEQAGRAGDHADRQRASSEHALWMWYMRRGRNPSRPGVDAASRVYALMRQLDPKHPAIITANKPSSPSSTSRIATSSGSTTILDPARPAKTQDSLRIPVRCASSRWREHRFTGQTGLAGAAGASTNAAAIRSCVRSRNKEMDRPNDSNHRPNEAELRALSAHRDREPGDGGPLPLGTRRLVTRCARTRRASGAPCLACCTTSRRSLEPVAALAGGVPGTGRDQRAAGTIVIDVDTRASGRTESTSAVANSNIHSPANVKRVEGAGGWRQADPRRRVAQAAGNHYDVRLPVPPESSSSRSARGSTRRMDPARDFDHRRYAVTVGHGADGRLQRLRRDSEHAIRSIQSKRSGDLRVPDHRRRFDGWRAPAWLQRPVRIRASRLISSVPRKPRAGQRCTRSVV